MSSPQSPTTEFVVEDLNPEFSNNTSAVPENFGPDHTNATPRINVDDLPPLKGVPKSTKRQPRKLSDVLGNLGKNKKARPGLRKLTEQDEKRIADMYTFAAIPLMPVNMRAAQTVVRSSDLCARGWMELADENDNVRRAILAMLEGGVWGKVFLAHVPILLALTPPSFLPKRMRNDELVDAMIEGLLAKISGDTDTATDAST